MLRALAGFHEIPGEEVPGGSMLSALQRAVKPCARGSKELRERGGGAVCLRTCVRVRASGCSCNGDLQRAAGRQRASERLAAERADGVGCG